jgi:outer membrane protein TolC
LDEIRAKVEAKVPAIGGLEARLKEAEAEKKALESELNLAREQLREEVRSNGRIRKEKEDALLALKAAEKELKGVRERLESVRRLK